MGYRSLAISFAGEIPIDTEGSPLYKSTTLFIASLLLFVPICLGQDFRIELGSDPFARKILPLLERYCGDCHAHEDKMSEFLWPQTEAAAAKLRNSFAAVHMRMEDKSMPPADAPQPSVLERIQIKNWIDNSFQLQPSDFDRLSTYVIESFADSQGNLWFGTIADGVARYDGTTLTWFSPKNGLGGDTVVSIAEDQQGSLWFGTEGGVTKYDGNTFATYSNAAGLPGTRCYVLVDRDGTLWVGTEHGVFRLQGDKFSKFNIPDPPIQERSWKVEYGKVWCLMQDRQGNIWFGRDGLGASRFDGTSFTHFTTNNGLCSNIVSHIVEDRAGNIWFGCLSSSQPQEGQQGGLVRWDGKTFTKFPETQGLFDTDIYTIYATKSGDVWIGATGVGAYRYDGTTFTLFDQTDRPYWTRYFGIQSMLEDRQGTLWFGFSGGLFRFDGQSFRNVGRNELSAAPADPPEN